jgi:hypothetical protein
MIEFVATSIITISSALLFGYWYRYTCLLILSTKTAKDYAGQVATANQMSFAVVQAQLSGGASADLDRLKQSLDRDYELVTFLLPNAAGTQGEHRLEDRMLQLDYQLMGACYKVSSRFSVSFAKSALEEMSMVVAHFANSLGERADCSSAA